MSDRQHPAPIVNMHTQVNNPSTRETVQWADHQNSRDFVTPASDGHWQMGDLDVRADPSP
jgi:hypothetical protein